MSSNAQAVWFFIAMVGCLLAGVWAFRTNTTRTFWDIHPGWIGLAAFIFVFFWIAVKA